MFNKILVATDLSHASDEVVCSLGSLQSLGTREAVLLECLNVRDVGGLAGTLSELAKPKLEEQRQRIASLGFETEAKVIVGLPQIDIEREARELGCSLVVIGSQGSSGLREFLLGSVASAVLHHASLPVLVLRVHGGEPGGNAPCEPNDCDFLRSVIFPTDFSDNAESAYRYVQETARRGARLVTLLHVHPPETSAELRSLAGSRLELLRADLLDLGAGDVRIELIEGNPKREVIGRARDDSFSLAVIGSQGQGYLAGAVLGSVSHGVAYQAKIPVLFVSMPL